MDGGRTENSDEELQITGAHIYKEPPAPTRACIQRNDLCSAIVSGSCLIPRDHLLYRGVVKRLEGNNAKLSSALISPLLQLHYQQPRSEPSAPPHNYARMSFYPTIFIFPPIRAPPR